MAKVAVLMPVRNAQDYLMEALDSVLDQTYPDFALLAGDDASTDDSLSILKAYWQERFGAPHEERMFLFSYLSYQGVAKTLNRLSEAKIVSDAEYIARADADDLSDTGRITLQVEYMDANPDCVLLGTGVRLIDSKSRVVAEPHIETNHVELDINHKLCQKGLYHSSTMIRRVAFEAVAGYNPDYEGYEDYDLFLRLAEVGRIHCLPEYLASYRQHPGMTSLQEDDTRRHKRIALRKETENRRWLARQLKVLAQ